MEISTTQIATYVGAGGAMGAGFSALRHGAKPSAIGLGIATGVAAGGVQSFVQANTGSSELGWLAAMGSGAVAGAALLGGFASPGMSPMKARGIGAAIGLGAGLLAPVAAGIVLAQLQGAK